MALQIQLLFLSISTLYHLIASWIETRTYCYPGKRIDIGNCKLHLYTLGQGSPTVVIDHSLGGIDGYFLAEKIAQMTQVCIYDRAGYGWSDSSSKPRSSEQIVEELDLLLTQARIVPPYILLGDSFGSYNVRLYAHHFPEKVAGIVLTDGLHETAMVNMPLRLNVLKLFFMSGFMMSVVGAGLGIIRLLGLFNLFEVLKKELRTFPAKTVRQVKRSFYRPKHWITMLRELWNLDASGYQVESAKNFGDLPIVSIKANAFFRRSLWNFWMPLRAADRLRDEMHLQLKSLSTHFMQIQTHRSGHFVWVDEPETILQALRTILNFVE